MAYCSQHLREDSIVICVDDYCNFDMAGRAYCGVDGSPVLFRRFDKAIIGLDYLLDVQGGPCSATQRRSFLEPRVQKNGENRNLRQRREGVFLTEKKEGSCPSGNQATFMVQVQYRQNATWQGELVWVDKDEKKHFRSVLELMMLMNSALEEGDIKEQVIG